MNKKQIILVGGGGHCKSCIEVIESSVEFEIAGIIDVKEKIGDFILGYEIIGCDDDLIDLKKRYEYAIVTVGQIKSNQVRVNIYKNLKELGYKLPVIVASTAIVSRHSKIESGTIVMHQSFVNADCVIGENCIINSKVLVEHDCVVGNNCHISTGSKINGNVNIGNDCFVGSNSSLVNGIMVADRVLLGINSLVIKSIKEAGIYAGNPLRKIK